MDYHSSLHIGRPHCVDHVVLSVDGVQEGNSTTRSLLIYSVRFAGCRYIYIIAVVRALPGVAVDHCDYLQKVVDDIKLVFNS